MPLLNPTKKIEKKTVKISLPNELIDTIQKYCQWSSIKSLDEFYEQAATFVFSKDKEWVSFQKKAKKMSNNRYFFIQSY